MTSLNNSEIMFFYVDCNTNIISNKIIISKEWISKRIIWMWECRSELIIKWNPWTNNLIGIGKSANLMSRITNWEVWISVRSTIRHPPCNLYLPLTIIETLLSVQLTAICSVTTKFQVKTVFYLKMGRFETKISLKTRSTKSLTEFFLPPNQNPRELKSDTQCYVSPAKERYVIADRGKRI